MSQTPMSLFEVKSAPVAVGSPLPVVVWKEVFTPMQVDAIVTHGDGLRPMKAEIAGRKDNIDHMRVTRVAWVERKPETQWLYARLEEMVLQINAQFYRYDLYGLIEAFQYTVYEGGEGGHFGWHVDVGEKNYEPRKISLSVQLSDPSGYEGGDLILQPGASEYRAEKACGTLIAFPSFVRHRVMPVTSGTRKSLVIWVAGPEYR